jgi:SAM-dependent methyltransferase
MARRAPTPVILRWLEQIPPARILDLGTSSGLLAQQARLLGHEVTAVDVLELPEVAGRVDRFIQADLDQGLPAEVTRQGPYQVALTADILEHVRTPERLLAEIREVLVPRGTLIASVPNFGHWYARGRVLLGLFDYDQRGVLDQGHVRFFTRRGLLRRLRNAGYQVVRSDSTGLPLEVLTRSGGTLQRIVRLLDRLAVLARPTLFAYQFVVQCETSPEPTVVSDS